MYSSYKYVVPSSIYIIVVYKNRSVTIDTEWFHHIRSTIIYHIEHMSNHDNLYIQEIQLTMEFYFVCLNDFFPIFLDG